MCYMMDLAKGGGWRWQKNSGKVNQIGGGQVVQWFSKINNNGTTIFNDEGLEGCHSLKDARTTIIIPCLFGGIILSSPLLMFVRSQPSITMLEV